jgi:hypothetical protein
MTGILEGKAGIAEFIVVWNSLPLLSSELSSKSQEYALANNGEMLFQYI